jgi:GTPase SAR1 family protein
LWISSSIRMGNCVEMEENKKIGVVGPCASGKSTLINGLKKLGYTVRHIAQEHSYAPTMWERISHPNILIFLDVSFQVSQMRRDLNWNLADFEEQQRRLSHARSHANFYLNTDLFTPEEVLERVTSFLDELGLFKEAS